MKKAANNIKECAPCDPGRALQNEEQGEKKHQFKNGGVREGGEQNEDEDKQNNGLKHLGGCEGIESRISVSLNKKKTIPEKK